MKQRVVTALIAFPLVAGIIFLGGIYLYLLMAAAVVIGLYEFHRAFGYEKNPLLPGMTVLSSLVYIGLFYLNQKAMASTVIGIMLMLELGIYVLCYPKIPLRQVFTSVIGFLYIPYMLMHAILIREGLVHGKHLIWLVIFIAFGSDTFAYFSGVTMGKHKLAPILSPKKTIEGAVGGVIGSMVICLLYGFYLDSQGILFLPKIAYFSLAALGLLGSIFSQIGDLVGSAIKRETGIKDFGTLFPGHGGILDRLDSIIFVAPFVYYFMLLLYRWN